MKIRNNENASIIEEVEQRAEEMEQKAEELDQRLEKLEVNMEKGMSMREMKLKRKSAKENENTIFIRGTVDGKYAEKLVAKLCPSAAKSPSTINDHFIKKNGS